jgi:hypothetical protein
VPVLGNQAMGSDMKTDEQTRIVEAIQKTTVRLVATSPAGHDLLLIGGFRYRFLDQSVRTSKDIDYHWEGDLEEKQRELLALFRKRLLPALHRQFGYEGGANVATGPDADSPAVKTVVVALWKPGVEFSRIEIPVEVTRVVHADKTEIRTLDGVVYPTLSDADMIECKIVAVFNRQIMEHRDLVDAFLFGSQLIPGSPERLKRKFKKLEISAADIAKRLADLEKHASYHAKAIQAVLDSQLEPDTAKNVNAAGGAARVLKQAMETIRRSIGAT